MFLLEGKSCMCVPANRASVSDSLHALVHSFLPLAGAFLALVVAVATAPRRLMRPAKPRRWRPASTSHVQVQVHLEEHRRVREIERSCRATLKRAAETWAPHPLPLDRVEVLSSAPPLGKADIYERWVEASADDQACSLVVVCLGTTTDQRSLTSDETAGALAGQIEFLVNDRYRREHGEEQPAAPTPKQPERVATVASRQVGAAGTPIPDATPPADNVTELSSVRALLADIKKSQPLVTAGPSQNGIHSEPNPAS